MNQAPSAIVWMTPTLLALFAWGIGQGLVKKYIVDVPPARFCLYLVFAKAVINLGYFFSQDHPNPFAANGLSFMALGLTAYILDGTAWILYFFSIISGPITIVGTLSAAYPALTVLFARIFLAEVLTPLQYFGISLVILACLGLSYDFSGQSQKVTQRRWIVFASFALLLWGIAQVLVKYAYTLEGASDANLALFNTMGGFLTLGVYGLLYGLPTKTPGRTPGSNLSTQTNLLRSFIPMAMMALGDLFVIIALANGPSSIVSPISGAYPLVTLIFAWIVLKERIHRFHWACVVMVLIGIFLSPGQG